MPSLAGRASVERIPVLLVGLLGRASALPVLDPAIESGDVRPTTRSASLAEADALVWVALWNGRKIAGSTMRRPSALAAYRDCYDYATGSDVRELVHIVGAPRGVVEMLSTLRAEAKESGRRLIGSVSALNTPMRHALERLGYRATRIVYEDATV